ncbi:hypothetical protein [Romboutsia ilealis]|uniref:Uncharacterized protein n=2 Tax=Romboutsia ilealis TaxID=1115758 RepID=A0A1V1HZD7_9FIRM|nr:hypothetical protein [Romboutsia ilealis]CED93273.1 Hypothetical protein CRIB_518 [Romboutsia ilealis]
MLIKLNIEGELLELLKKDAEINCRTNPQQILYYLRQIYSGQLSVSNNTQVVQIEVPTVNQEIPIVNNEVQGGNNTGLAMDISSINYSTNMVQQQELEGIPEIDDDILNF